MAKDPSKVFLNVGGYTLKQIKSITRTSQDQWKQDDVDIYGNSENIEINDPRTEFKVGVTRGGEDELYLYNAAEAKLEFPFLTYQDKSGMAKIAESYINAVILHNERDGGSGNNESNYIIKCFKVQNLATK